MNPKPDSASPENLVSIHELQSQSLTRKIMEIEGRVVELEKDLLRHANQLHNTITSELMEFFPEMEESEIIEFEGGQITESSATDKSEWISYGDTSDEVFTTLDSARQKLEFLNQKIDKMHLPR